MARTFAAAAERGARAGGIAGTFLVPAVAARTSCSAIAVSVARPRPAHALGVIGAAPAAGLARPA
jgi:hypothetical protein